MRKMKSNQKRTHLLEERLGNVSMQEQEDMVVIDQVPDERKRKKVVTEEIGDMVVVDTLDQTPVKKRLDDTKKDGKRVRKTKLSMDDSHASLSDLNANSRESTGTESYTTSENEYYTAYDVTADDDIGSLLYHTAFVDELDEGAAEDTDQVETDTRQDRVSQKINTEVPVSRLERSDVALSFASPGDASNQPVESSYENITFGSYTQQSTFEYPSSGTKVKVLKPFTFYKDYVSPTSCGVIDQQPTSLNRKLFKELDLSDSDVVAAASTNMHCSDEVMINFPPTVGISRGSPQLMTKATLSSTPSSSPSLSRKSFRESVSVTDQVITPLRMVSLQTPHHLRRRSSSTSSRSSLKGQTKTGQSQPSHDKTRTPSELANDHKNQREHFASTEKTLAADISKIIDNMDKVCTSTDPEISQATSKKTSASSKLSSVAVIKVKSQQVHVRHTSLGSYGEVEQGSQATIQSHSYKQHELVLSPDLLSKSAQAEPDIEAGLDFSIVKQRGSYRKIVQTADRYRIPIAVTSIFLLITIAALVIMAVFLPLT
uniref:Uncharacterized protein LOC100177226 n=1 Tax=Phallusia mammillata TaxID=59560 RepID=A0A6F9DFX3_9ASCI|nr:uncharacterized protein LOC100177226 [Phallusia mammillata]